MPRISPPPNAPLNELAEEIPALAPLNERIAALRAEIDAAIDALAELQKCAGVPLAVIRQTITRGSSCQCRSYLIATGEIR